MFFERNFIMKDIKNFEAPKYAGGGYERVGDGVYKTVDGGNTVYVTSLSFVQEPEFGEGANAAEIAQYPLEDILDKFLCYISDFYPQLNTAESSVCYQEFAALDAEAVGKLRTAIIGKHVYEVNGTKLTIE